MRWRTWGVAALELGGAAAVLVGIWLVYPPASLIVGGVGAIAFAIAIERGGAG